MLSYRRFFCSTKSYEEYIWLITLSAKLKKDQNTQATSKVKKNKKELLNSREDM